MTVFLLYVLFLSALAVVTYSLQLPRHNFQLKTSQRSIHHSYKNFMTIKKDDENNYSGN